MESSSASGVLGAQGQQNPTGHDAFGDVDLGDFITLLVTELQNQDPLDPMNNHEILEQISQIREIESNQRLTSTLASVQLGQSFSTACSMLGRTIQALAADGNTVTGSVDRVSIEDGTAKLHLGEHVVDLTNVSEILNEPETNLNREGE